MLLFLSIITPLLFVLQSLFLKGSREIGDGGKTAFFYINASYTGLIAIGFILIYLFTGELQINAPTLYIGILFGCVFTGTMFFYSKAMDTGPLSYSAFYFSMALIIPVMASILFWKEAASAFKIVGILFFLIAFYMINVHGNEKSRTGKTFNRQWMVYCFLAFLFNGTIPTLFKLHQSLLPGREEVPFMFIGFGAALLFSIFGVVISARKQGQPVSFFAALSIKSWLIILGLAGSTGIANLLLTSLSGQLPGVYLFPLVNGSMIVCLTIISVLVFKEPISRGGIAGILIGILAIVAVNL